MNNSFIFISYPYLIERNIFDFNFKDLVRSTLINFTIKFTVVNEHNSADISCYTILALTLNGTRMGLECRKFCHKFRIFGLGNVAVTVYIDYLLKLAK